MIIYRRIGKPEWPKWYEVQWWAIDLKTEIVPGKGVKEWTDAIPVGYCACRVRENGEAYTDVFVDEKYRGQGIGFKLKEMALTYAFTETKATVAASYCARKNYASIGNMMKEGYRFTHEDAEQQFHFTLPKATWERRTRGDSISV